MVMKLYKDMTPEEQLKWVTDFSSFATDKLPLLEKLGDAWETADRKDMETGLQLIQAFSIARDFAQTSLAFGDYQRRVDRLRFYVDRIKKEIAKGMTVQGLNGETYAYIPTLQPRLRRGRPTREEAIKRREMLKDFDATEVEKQQKIALLMGMKVVTNEQPREKNNAELAEEKEAIKREQEKQSPSLFANTEQTEQKADGGDGDNGDAQDLLSLSATLPHLDQIRWLLSEDLAERTKQVQQIRATAAAMAERAKTLAMQGASSDEVAPCAQRAAKLTADYEQVYTDVDRELAKAYLRLREDASYLEELKKKVGLKDPSMLIKQLRPYYNKVSSEDPLFTTSVRAWIDENNPEAVKAREAAEEKKKQVDLIIRYLRRQDKQPTKKRIEGMREKYKELVQLIGEKEASVYLPFVEKTIKDNVAYEKEKAEKKAKKQEKK